MRVTLNIQTRLHMSCTLRRSNIVFHWYGIILHIGSSLNEHAIYDLGVDVWLWPCMDVGCELHIKCELSDSNTIYDICECPIIPYDTMICLVILSDDLSILNFLMMVWEYDKIPYVPYFTIYTCMKDNSLLVYVFETCDDLELRVYGSRGLGGVISMEEALEDARSGSDRMWHWGRIICLCIIY